MTRQHIARYSLLVAPLFAVFAAALDLTVIATLLPGIIFDLEIAFTELDRAAWIVTAYLLGYTVAIPLLGRLSDRAGRRPVFLLALALFAAGSLWCARADGLGALIAGRAVQALGGGAMVPVTMALAAELLPPGRRAAALGLVAAVDTAGWVAGPLWGAALVQWLGDWRWVFLVNLPIAALAAAAVLGARSLPKGTHMAAEMPSRRWLAGIDWPGAALLTLGLLGLNLGLSLGQEAAGAGMTLDRAGAPSPLAPYRPALLLGGLAALVALVLVERRAVAPLVPVGLWRRPAFAAASLVNLLLGAALIVAMVNVPVFVTTLASDLATAQTQSALLLTPLTAGMMLGSLAGGWLAGRRGPRAVAGAGLLLAALAFAQMGTWPARLELGAMALTLGVLGLGFGLTIAPAASAAIDSAGRADYGIASALVLVLRLVGMAAGLSALTAWALAQVTGRLAALPPMAAGEAGPTDPARLAAELAARAVAVTTRVLDETFWVAGGLCLLALVPAWWLGRHTPAGAARRTD